MDEQRKIKSFCALCVARCGAIATVERGRFVSLEPDPSHPTGQALCAKGRASPELVYSSDRLLHPLKRTRPKGNADPGWQRVSWDEALDLTASAMQRNAEQHRPEAFAFSVASGSTTASADFAGWIRRLMNAYGSRTWRGASRSVAGAAPLPPASRSASAASESFPAMRCRISRMQAASFSGATIPACLA
jgi:anaerobic selenocysteine-containing dehydrogenase